MKYVLLFCGTRELQQAWEDMTEEARSAQYAEVNALSRDLDHYHLFHAIRSELLLELSEREQARASALRALELTQNRAEQSLLTRRLLEW